MTPWTLRRVFDTMAILFPNHRSAAMACLAIFLAACSNPSSPRVSVQTVLAHQAIWRGQGLHNYSYTYEFVAFNRFANQPLQIDVRQDTVRSVVVLARGENLDPTHFPSIDGLFEQALGAAQNGSLTHIAFDPARGYPTVLGYQALPDALSSQQATDLQPTP